jgi:hypothetical protein
VRHESRFLVGCIVVTQHGYHGLVVGARVGANSATSAPSSGAWGRGAVEILMELGTRAHRFAVR